MKAICFSIAPRAVFPDPATLAREIRDIVGVVEHGLFLGMADLALISDGESVTEYTKNFSF